MCVGFVRAHVQSVRACRHWLLLMSPSVITSVPPPNRSVGGRAPSKCGGRLRRKRIQVRGHHVAYILYLYLYLYCDFVETEAERRARGRDLACVLCACVLTCHEVVGGTRFYVCGRGTLRVSAYTCGARACVGVVSACFWTCRRAVSWAHHDVFNCLDGRCSRGGSCAL